jgi:hypothetical protein
MNAFSRPRTNRHAHAYHKNVNLSYQSARPTQARLRDRWAAVWPKREQVAACVVLRQTSWQANKHCTHTGHQSGDWQEENYTRWNEGALAYEASRLHCAAKSGSSAVGTETAKWGALVPCSFCCCSSMVAKSSRNQAPPSTRMSCLRRAQALQRQVRAQSPAGRLPSENRDASPCQKLLVG